MRKSIPSEELDQRMKAAFDAAKMALWEYDSRRGQILWTGFIPRHFADLTRSFDGTLKSYLDLVHLDDKADVKKITNNIKNGESFYSEHRVFWPDGSIRWLEFVGTVVVSETVGIKMTGTVRDITEKMQLHQEREDWKAKYELVAKNAGLVVFDYNMLEDKIRWSGNVEAMFGKKPDDLDHIAAWEDFIHPEDRKYAVKAMEKAQKNLSRYNITYRFKTPSGYKYISDRGFFQEKGGKTVRMLGIMSDISEIKNAELALRESQQRFKSMVMNMSLGVSIYDQNTQPVMVNKMGHEMFDLSEEEFLLKKANDTDWQVIHPDGSDMVSDKFPIPRAIKDGKPVQKEIIGVYRPKSHDWIWLLLDALPIFDDHGEFVHVVCTYSDITNLKKAQTELSEKNDLLVTLSENLASSNDRLLEFAQIVSHNLRAPISNIVSLTRIYSQGSKEQKKKTVEHIDDISNRALATIDDLNEVLKIQQDEGVEKQNLKFEEVLNDVLVLQENAILQKNATVHSHFAEENILYPIEYLESIYLNLLSNSLRFKKADDACIIEVNTFRDEHDNIILEWKDNGVGMDLDLHGDDIFQLGKTFHTVASSRGVGLFMIKNQVNAMGGTIVAHSEPKRGMTITINLTKHL